MVYGVPESLYPRLKKNMNEKKKGKYKLGDQYSGEIWWEKVLQMFSFLEKSEYRFFFPENMIY